MEDAFVKLGLSLGRLIRYAYSGFLFCLLAAHVEPEKTRQTVEALGPVLSPIVALLVGVGIWVFYREFIGELILYPIRHLIHTTCGHVRNRWRSKRGKAPIPLGSFTHYFGTLKVTLGSRRWVYRTLRSSDILPETDRKKLELVHSEFHVLYITAVEFAGAALWQGALGRYPWFLASIALITLIVVFYIDIRQDAFETHVFRTLDDKIRPWLKELGF